MKRNMDLIRVLLFTLEQKGHNPTVIDGFSQQEIEYHKALIIEAGLAEGVVATGNFNEVMRADIDRLTWEGHDFIDAARDETLWKEAKEKLMKPGLSFTFEMIKEWLKSEIRGRFGLG
jgi:hypothetical protein